MNQGMSNKPMYDDHNYNQDIMMSAHPGNYRMYVGATENAKKCRKDNFYRKYDLVDIETELKNMNRPLSQSPYYQYSPQCVDSGMCLSTFDKNAPTVMPPDLCPIVQNNLPKYNSTGIQQPGAAYSQVGRPY